MLENPELIRIANCGVSALASDVFYGLDGFDDDASRIDYLSHALYFAYMAGMNSN